MMEVFAGFTAETDHEMGRLLEVVRSLPDADNTIVLYQSATMALPPRAAWSAC